MFSLKLSYATLKKESNRKGAGTESNGNGERYK